MPKPTARRTLMTLFLSVFAAVAVQALAAQPLRADSFSAWVSQLWPEAEAAGVSKSTFDRVFSGLKPNCKLPGVYCPGERKKPAGRKLSERTGLPEACNKITQPEFLKPEKYFPEGYMRNLALRGRKILNDLEAEGPETLRHLKEIERSFRVSRNMLMGLWGRETAFGRAKLNYNGFRSLASYAWAGYKSRQGWSREQLIAALIMVERGHMTPGQFKSSYAGATGLTQIMPDEFVGFAVDGDQDGKKDIWNSIPDAMATTANVLKDRGWHSAPRSWGYEIKLPEPSETFDCTMEKRANRFPIGDWRDRFGIACSASRARAAALPGAGQYGLSGSSRWRARPGLPGYGKFRCAEKLQYGRYLCALCRPSRRPGRLRHEKPALQILYALAEIQLRRFRFFGRKSVPPATRAERAGPPGGHSGRAVRRSNARRNRALSKGHRPQARLLSVPLAVQGADRQQTLAGEAGKSAGLTRRHGGERLLPPDQAQLLHG